MQKLSVRIQDPAGRPGYYKDLYGTDEGYVEADGRSQKGTSELRVFIGGRSTLVPVGRIVYIRGNGQPVHPGQTERHTQHVDTLTDAYELAQTWIREGRRGLEIKQLTTDRTVSGDMGWYVVCKATEAQQAA